MLMRLVTASSGRDRHRPSPPEHFQLDWSALNTSDAECYPPVVNLVVAESLEESVADLSQA